MDRDASVALYPHQVCDFDVWALVFVRNGFVQDDALGNKCSEAKLGYSTHYLVTSNLNSEGYFKSYILDDIV